MSQPQLSGQDAALHRIADATAGPGWCVSPGFLPPAEVSSMRTEALGLREQGAFRPAGIGGGQGLALHPEVRSDRIHWVGAETRGPAIQRYLGCLEVLRRILNRDLFLGLDDFEGHLAVYPPGSFYRRHLDQPRGSSRRTLSCILYLNPDWQPADGGVLRIYTGDPDPGGYEEVAPLGGTLATFLSARFEHEVLPARRERLSLTGWFRRRA